MATPSQIEGDYVIDRFNGARVSEGYTLSITSVDATSVRIHCRIANTMNGTLTLKDGILSGMLMSTMMLGSEEQQKIEAAIGSGFDQGMSVKSHGRVLLLHYGNTAIRLRKA